MQLQPFGIDINARNYGKARLGILSPAAFNSIHRASAVPRGCLGGIERDALKPGADAVIAVVLDVKEGFHAQSHKPLDENLIPCVVSLDDNANATAADAVYPAGKIETYPQLGKLSVYTARSIIYVPVHLKPDAAPGPVKISGVLRVQICDDAQCFKPQKLPFVIDTKIVAASADVAPANAELFHRVRRRA